MAVYIDVKCPNCKKSIGRYRTDLKVKSENHGSCNNCHEKYIVVCGNDKAKASKNKV